MKKLFTLLIFVTFTKILPAQTTFLKSRTVQIAGSTVYIVSPADLGFPKNILGANYQQIVDHAAQKGYKPCPKSMVDELYRTYSDGMQGNNWTAFRWLTVCSSDGVTYTIGKGSGGKFLQSSVKETLHIFLEYTHACLVFVK